MKKVRLVSLLALAAASVGTLIGCNSNNGDGKAVKIGLICLHDSSSTYDANFINAMDEAVKNLGDKVVFEKNCLLTGVPEDNSCYDAAKDLVERGCKVIIADSFGHQTAMLNAAKDFPDVQFCHATGTHAHTSNLANFANAFASIYEGRYLAGVAAGLKLQEMGKTNAPKIGYIGAFTYAEVISGYTSFYLGVKSIVPSVTMEVTFTGSWYDETAENNAAKSLIQRGCVLISQHADSWGAPNACEEAGVPNVSYNGSTVDSCPNTFIVASRINWEPYFKYIIEQKQAGKAIDTDWTGTIATGSVVLTDINDKAAAAGTKEAIDNATEQLKAGTLHVFATDTFTVKGETLSEYLADVDTDANYTPDTNVISDGFFHESEKRSAPYFDLRIDGIELLNEKY